MSQEVNVERCGVQRRRAKGQCRTRLMPSTRRLSRRKIWVEKRRQRRVERMYEGIEMQLERLIGPAVPSIPVPSAMPEEDPVAILSSENRTSSPLRAEVSEDHVIRCLSGAFEYSPMGMVYEEVNGVEIEFVDSFDDSPITSQENSAVLEEVKSDESSVAIKNKSRNGMPEDANDRFIVEGNRLVDMTYFFEEMQRLARHSERFACGLAHFKIKSEKRTGLKTVLHLQCAMCNYKAILRSHPEEQSVLDVNHGAVAGTLSTGGGYAQLEEFLGAMNVPCMKRRFYDTCHDNIMDGLKAAAAKQMEIAATEEKKLAIARGDVVPNTDLPFIPVISDGAWLRRSYKSGKFSSLSGVGAIVGFHTKKILFIAVRNKFCGICQTAAKKNVASQNHRCFKNWGRDQASTGMETDIIVEGFKCSIQMHGLVYATLISDGDSSVYKKILDNDPYKGLVRVKKVECTNHVLRGMMRRIDEILPKIPRGPCRAVVEKNALRLRTAVLHAAMHRMGEKLPHQAKIEELKKDIDNIPSHVFGEHKHCGEIGYFCEGPKKNEPNMIPQLVEAGAYQKIVEAMRRPRIHADSLLFRMNNNAVESFNGLIAKYIGGKRINFGRKGSYEARCAAAAIQHNTGEIMSNLCRAMNKEPSGIQRGIERRRKMQVVRTRNAKAAAKKRGKVRRAPATKDQDYGDAAEVPVVEAENHGNYGLVVE